MDTVVKCTKSKTLGQKCNPGPDPTKPRKGRFTTKRTDHTYKSKIYCLWKQITHY